MRVLDRTQAANLLRDAGLRLTAPRVAVLETLSRMPHSSAEAITIDVRGSLGSVSTQAVYDVLNALTESGLARRIEPAGHSGLFETRTGDNHHHLGLPRLRRSCGRGLRH